MGFFNRSVALENDATFKDAEPFTGEMKVAVEQLGSPMIAASDKDGNVMTAPVLFEDIDFEYVLIRHVTDEKRPWVVVRDYGRFYSKDGVDTFLALLSEESPEEAEGVEAAVLVVHTNIVSLFNVKLHEKRRNAE